MDFYQKYIKYKNKYLSLKKAIKGGNSLSDYVLLELDKDNEGKEIIIKIHYYILKYVECPEFYTIENIVITKNDTDYTISKLPRESQYHIYLNENGYKLSFKETKFNDPIFNETKYIEFTGDQSNVTDVNELKRVWNKNIEKENIIGYYGEEDTYSKLIKKCKINLEGSDTNESYA
jgi:hypothetical protein